MSANEFVYQFKGMEHILKAFAMKLSNDFNDAEDLYQETAYRAFKYREMFKSETNLKAWLMTIMRNVFINDYRKKKKNRTLSDWTDTDYLIDSGNHSTGNSGEVSMAVEEIQAYIAKLDSNLATPFKMRFMGYKYQEIADELSLPLGTVKSRIFMARKELQYNLSKVA
ncbi:MAG: sigma-70 family RNA polymerase sigma factor [Bacteroidota bacterium]